LFISCNWTSITIIQVSNHNFNRFCYNFFFIFFYHIYSVEARELVRSAVNATTDDEVIFCDNPCERLCYLLCNPNYHSSNSLNNNSNKHINNNNNHNHTINVDDVSTMNDTSTSTCSTSNISIITDSNSTHGPILFISTTESLNGLKVWTEAGVQVFLCFFRITRKLSMLFNS
jgi:hypothetical protein